LFQRLGGPEKVAAEPAVEDVKSMEDLDRAFVERRQSEILEDLSTISESVDVAGLIDLFGAVDSDVSSVLSSPDVNKLNKDRLMALNAQMSEFMKQPNLPDEVKEDLKMARKSSEVLINASDDFLKELIDVADEDIKEIESRISGTDDSVQGLFQDDDLKSAMDDEGFVKIDKKLSKSALNILARFYELPGRSKMTKEDIIFFLERQGIQKFDPFELANLFRERTK